ncbi:DUF4123 domain-containing protein [Bordetella sp. LUAb4]|uniref:DUF4123 domain-containing protein n=1 Tax=Bordetella sp. LUAb4 TaxID=2843195 RepID=UPI001E63AA75|nr:DUF4123 domain-containing protein [Bordetella sp. LUAb4]
MNTSETERLFGLLDGAQYPKGLADLVRKHSSEVCFLFEGFPEREAGDSGPILFAIDDLSKEWVAQIDLVDLHRPCFSVLRSALAIDALQRHLQRFLFADIGEGIEVLLRFYDPRSLPSILTVLDVQWYATLVRPVTKWVYRGCHQTWQEVPLDCGNETPAPAKLPLSLSQAQLDDLERFDEPHRILSELCDQETITAEEPYADRYLDFRRRYDRAVAFGLSPEASRKTFCSMSYMRGEHFYQHDEIRSAILSSVRQGVLLAPELYSIPESVWDEAKAISAA